MKPKFADYYMKMAELTSTLSYAKRLQVGAVIVKDHKILAAGYNGMPSGWENNCETETEDGLVTKPEVLHAEMNALMKVCKSTESTEGATIFVTHAPCINCAKAIYQSGISHYHYRDDYRSDEGLIFLRNSGVTVSKHLSIDEV